MTDTKPREDIVCPFCHEGDFDLPGLKMHLTHGWCEVFDEIDGRSALEKL